VTLGIWLARVVRRVFVVVDFLDRRGTTSGWLSTVVAVELDERRVAKERDVVVVLVRVLMLGRWWSSTDMLSGVKLVSLRELVSVIQGTDVHSSMGGRVVKFMHGASGPQREG
jgi:hypothetical protein